MSCRERVYAWRAEVAARLPHLSGPEATVLALWSFGMVLARSCGRTAVGAVLAAGLGRGEGALRQRLREFCYAAADKRGAKRRVLAVSVLYRGCAIPVAWAVLPANRARAWRREWLRLLRRLGPAVPAGWTVVVLADRGLYARWLFRRIVRLGWHPLLRVNAGGTFRPAGRARYAPLRSFAAPGADRRIAGTAFQGSVRRLPCTLLVRWEAGQAEPWFLLTDLPPAAADACWYGLRAWIEQGFKLAKRAGWQWQATRVTDPARAARLWLAVAVATLWLVSLGGAAEAALPVSTVPALPPPPPRAPATTRPRLVSVFRRGYALWLAALLDGRPLPTGRFHPEPWPTAADPTPARLAACHAKPTLESGERV